MAMRCHLKQGGSQLSSRSADEQSRVRESAPSPAAPGPMPAPGTAGARPPFMPPNKQASKRDGHWVIAGGARLAHAVGPVLPPGGATSDSPGPNAGRRDG